MSVKGSNPVSRQALFSECDRRYPAKMAQKIEIAVIEAKNGLEIVSAKKYPAVTFHNRGSRL